MTNPEDLGAPENAELGGAAGEPLEPYWAAIRMTANRPNLLALGPRVLHRDHMYLVDLNEPHIQNELRKGWMVALPADMQPQLTSDPDGNPQPEETPS